MKQIEWFGCYADSWQGEITPEAFSHPAKYSRGLITRIYDHMLAMGYVQPGDTIGDPFGGVALGAIHAMLKGLHWRGVELEPKFVELGNQNLDLWQAKYGDLLRGTAVLVQGDSRQFLQHVAGIGGVVSSAPFGANVEPPRFNDPTKGKRGRSVIGMQYADNPPGQLGAMREGDLSAVVSSPAYADVINGSGEGPGARYDHITHSGDNATKKSSQAEYGRTAGNLGNMDAVVSSAPFENSLTSKDEEFVRRAAEHATLGLTKGHGSSQEYLDRVAQWNGYGNHENNIGNDTGSTFWQAAAEIVAQAYAALKPGAYAAWVCGDYVRGGERVYFGRQWLELCESVGFVPVEWVTAWKTEYKGTQLDIFGNEHEKRIDRVSFFRRLANEKNPDAAVLNEDVAIVRKPL